DLIARAIELLCCGAVVTSELLHTASESVVDLVSPEFHPLAGRAKDISASAVWIISFTSAIVGLCVYIHALLG
ncbi:MAG: diacylglycerol kinase family protein, partial [Atopobiaceae bacterium]|nr:diacylglycerol kinase family protein [Atopobiaceae bacterium]